MSIEKTSKLSNKHIRFSTYTYWLLNNLKEKDIIDNELQKKIMDNIGIYKDVKYHKEYIDDFIDNEKEITKKMKQDIKQNKNGGVIGGKNKEKKKKGILNITSQNDDIITKIVNAANMVSE